MNYTNKHGLDSIFIQWLLKDDYDYIPGVISATTLIDPPRKTILEERHHDNPDVRMDISELINAKFGTAIHSSFEQIDFGPNVIQEKRMFADVDGERISGKYDMLIRLIKEGEQSNDDFSGFHQLRDLKTTSVWSYIKDSRTEGYIQQLSIYRFLLEVNGIRVSRDAKVMIVFTDWSNGQAQRQSDYPPIRMALKEIYLWNSEETVLWIKERLGDLRMARMNTDDNLPYCTDKELWKKPNKYAVMNKGGKKAFRVLDSEVEAQSMVDAAPDRYIETRHGKVKRCPKYCTYHSVCNQHQELVKQGVVE